MNVWPAVYDWLTSAVPNRPVIRRDQDGRLPDRTFVAAKVIAEQREGQAAVGRLREDGTVLIQQGALLTVSVHAFGDEAMDVAHSVRNSVNRISIQDRLRSRGLAYVRTLLGPQDLSAVVATGHEERAHLDVLFRTNVELLDEVGIIERVELTGVVDSVEYGPSIVGVA